MMYIPPDRLSTRRESGNSDYGTIDHTNQGNSFNNFGSLRRSLRQMNPFKSKLFRLPATPRLSRKNKGSSGVETTGWNFERPSSVASLKESISIIDSDTSQQNINTNSYHHNSPSLMIRKNNGEHIKIESFRKSSIDSSFETKNNTPSLITSPLRSSSFRGCRNSVTSITQKDIILMDFYHHREISKHQVILLLLLPLLTIIIIIIIG